MTLFDDLKNERLYEKACKKTRNHSKKLNPLPDEDAA